MRWLVWTHFFEPHSRYMEHDEFPVHEGGLKGLEAKYDAEVSFADKYIGEVLDALEAAGQAKTTAVVIFSDHGEAFGEHRFGGERMYFHGQTLYDELLRVPLMFRIPGVAPRVVDGNVQLARSRADAVRSGQGAAAADDARPLAPRRAARRAAAAARRSTPRCCRRRRGTITGARSSTATGS